MRIVYEDICIYCIMIYIISIHHVNFKLQRENDMSWNTYYKFDGYLSRISKHEIDDKIEECTETIDRIFREILAYMAMKPPVMAHRYTYSS